MVGRADAFVFTGGSVFGLGAADGVTALLSSRNIGLRLAPTSPAIPIVPAAVLHDLGNEGDKDWGLEPPYRELGIAAAKAASEDFALGAVGAGRGAHAGSVQGGVGSASADLGDGLMVGAFVAANPLGSVLCPTTKPIGPGRWSRTANLAATDRLPICQARLTPFPAAPASPAQNANKRVQIRQSGLLRSRQI